LVAKKVVHGASWSIHSARSDAPDEASRICRVSATAIRRAVIFAAALTSEKLLVFG